MMPGTRIQGDRHVQRRSVIPVKRSNDASVCVRAGDPGYPVTETYASRKPAIGAIQWKYAKPLASPDPMDAFERSVGYAFCPEFRECAMEHNGGRPLANVFDTDKAKGRVLKTLLSFDPDDRETVWKAIEWECMRPGYIPFAVSAFGDPICFDKTNGRVVLLDHESGLIEDVVDDFERFITSLREHETK